MEHLLVKIGCLYAISLENLAVFAQFYKFVIG